MVAKGTKDGNKELLYASASVAGSHVARSRRPCGEASSQSARATDRSRGLSNARLARLAQLAHLARLIKAVMPRWAKLL
jgi:hypothetical protein